MFEKLQISAAPSEGKIVFCVSWETQDCQWLWHIFQNVLYNCHKLSVRRLIVERHFGEQLTLAHLYSKLTADAGKTESCRKMYSIANKPKKFHACKLEHFLFFFPFFFCRRGSVSSLALPERWIRTHPWRQHCLLLLESVSLDSPSSWCASWPPTSWNASKFSFHLAHFSKYLIHYV